MEIEVRPAADKEEAKRIMAVCELMFGHLADEEELDLLSTITATERTFGAFDGETIIGSAANLDLVLTIPGGEIPAAGVTLIAVIPTHRRRGLLRTLMDTLLRDAMERRDPVAILWASESNIYQRFGYGYATRQAWIEASRDRFELLDPSPPKGTIRLIDKEEALRVFPPLYDEVRSRTPGMLQRTENGWKLRYRDPEKRREGASPYFYALHESDGIPSGYAVYNIKPHWGNTPKGRLLVSDFVATSPDATRDLWGFLFGVDLIETVETNFILAEDDPLQLMVTEPRRLEMHVLEALWLRILDLPAALEARSYLGSGVIVLELEDEMLPDNEGRWRIEAKAGRASVTKTSEPADARLHIRDLAATYLGAFSLANLVAAGRAVELQPGAAERFDGIFRTLVSPCCPEIF